MAIIEAAFLIIYSLLTMCSSSPPPFSRLCSTDLRSPILGHTHGYLELALVFLYSRCIVVLTQFRENSAIGGNPAYAFKTEFLLKINEKTDK